MKMPKELFVECPVCGEKTSHAVLGGRVEGKRRIVMHPSVKCCVCSHVHTVELVEEHAIEIPILISWMDTTERSTLTIGPSEPLEVGDEVYVGGERLIVTSLEVNDRRVSKASADKISAIWAKKFDKVRLKISLDYRGKVLSKELLAVPEEEFAIGDEIGLDGRDAVITSIRTGRRTLKKGMVPAREIVRIYAKRIRR